MFVRNHRPIRPIARLIPEPAAQNALLVLGDLYRTLDEETAAALADALRAARHRGKGNIAELRNPWDSQAAVYLSPVKLAEIRFGLELMTSSRQKLITGND